MYKKLIKRLFIIFLDFLHGAFSFDKRIRVNYNKHVV